MKKTKLFLAIIALLCSAFVGLAPQTAYAEACDESRFMNLPLWYEGLETEKNPNDGSCSVKFPRGENEEKLRQYIWTIVLNVAGIIFGVAGYLAIAFIVVGGFMHILSRGDPGRAAGARKAIANAIIGLILCALASTIAGAVNAVAVRARDGTNFFVSVFNSAMLWAGIIAVIIIIVGGIYYTTSQGDPGRVVRAKNTIIYAIIGLIITLLAAAIVNMILGAL